MAESNNSIWVLAIHIYSPWIKHSPSFQTLLEQSYKLQYFLLYLFTVLRAKGPPSLFLSRPCLSFHSLIAPSNSFSRLIPVPSYPDRQHYRHQTSPAIAIAIYSCFSSSPALLAAEIHTRVLSPLPVYASASNIRCSVPPSDNHLWRTELQGYGSAMYVIQGLTHAPPFRPVLVYAPTTGSVGT